MSLKQDKQVHIAQTIKDIKQVANSLSLKKIRRLDFGDTMLLAKKLEQIQTDLRQIRLISDAGCSQLLEVLKYYEDKQERDNKGEQAPILTDKE